MAIAFGSVDTTPWDNGAGSSSKTQSFTTSGSNITLVVVLRAESTSDVITGVTYAGVSMSRVSTFQVVGGESAYTYVLGGAASGANNIIVSISPSTAISGRAAYYTGTSSTQPDNSTFYNSSGSVSSWSKAITPIIDNCWVVGGVSNDSSNSYTADSGDAVRGQISGSGSTAQIVDNSGPVHPAASTSLGYHSMDFAGDVGAQIFSIAPVPVSSVSPSVSPSQSPSSSLSASISPSQSPSSSKSPSVSPSRSPSISPSVSPSASVSPSVSPSPSPPQWTNQTADASAWVGPTRSTSSWTNATEDSSAWTGQNKTLIP